MLIKDASVVWNTLKGVVCVYKPADRSVRSLRSLLIHKICKELNEMDCRPPLDFVAIEGDPLKKLSVNVQPNLADHPLVVGPRYQEQDLPVSWANYLGWNTSGVLVFGLREGTKSAKFLRENRSTRAYRVKAVLGQATDNCFSTGKVVERSTWRHVRHHHLDRLLASIQASHQKKMFELCGVDIQSQTAYELAKQGPLRPANSEIPVIYGIKCVEYQPPSFTIEIQCINEYETYLMNLMHEIGLKLHSTAHCVALQCIRHSYFTLEDALLTKHWTLQNIITNLESCNGVIKEQEHVLLQKSAKLV